MRYIIDRFEDAGLAVLETATGELQVPRTELPPDAREGDTVVLLPRHARDGALRYATDPAATARRRRQSEALRASLPRAEAGDLEL